MYTYSQLKRSKVKELKILAEYLQIDIEGMNKEEIIDEILEQAYKEENDEAQIERSVRIRRIEELNR